jgi:beta-galactosidase/beta-glucuronidase
MVLVLMLAPALWAAQTPVRERLSFNADWRIPAGGSEVAEGAVTITHPKLWGPPPQQQPHRYVAVTTVWHRDRQIDRYETPFGIRDTPEHGQGGGIRTPPQ